MDSGFWIVIAIIFAVVAYTIGKVITYMRKSDRQWQDVDKSKLREWNDEDW